MMARVARSINLLLNDPDAFVCNVLEAGMVALPGVRTAAADP